MITIVLLLSACVFASSPLASKRALADDSRLFSRSNNMRVLSHETKAEAEIRIEAEFQAAIDLANSVLAASIADEEAILAAIIVVEDEKVVVAIAQAYANADAARLAALLAEPAILAARDIAIAEARAIAAIAIAEARARAALEIALDEIIAANARAAAMAIKVAALSLL